MTNPPSNNGHHKSNGKPKKPAKKKAPATRKAGQPKAITGEKEKVLLAFIQAGGSRTKAAEYVGIHTSTIENEARRNPQFLDKLTHAEATSYQKHLSNVANAGGDDWRASAFLLERKWRKEFGRQLDVNQNLTSEIAIRVAGMTPEQARDALATRLAGLLPEEG